MQRLDLINDDAHNQDRGRNLTSSGNCPTLPQFGNEGVISYGLCSRDVKL